MTRLAGKKALVVGAAGKDNMGQIIARRLAKEGATVAVAGRNMDALREQADAISGLAIKCEFTKRESIAQMVKAANEGMGGLDIAVNATGWGLLKPFLDMTDEEFDTMYELQLRGPFQLFQELIKTMKDNGGGSIIQVSSATAVIMLEEHSAYMATKAGTDHMLRTVANEFGRFGIRANSISPGLTETPMTADAGQVPGLLESFRDSYPLGRWGTSQDIAAGCVWLASDECFMTGENLQVNGGLTLRTNPSKKEMEESIAAASAAAG